MEAEPRENSNHAPAESPGETSPGAPVDAATPSLSQSSSTEYQLRAPWREHLLGLAIGLIGALIVMASYHGIGWSWDEAYYFGPSEDVVRHLGKLLTPMADESSAFSAEVIDEHWAEIKECPAVCKVLMGGSQLLLGDLLGEMRAARFPSAAIFGLTIYLIFLLGRAYRGRLAGLAAVAVYCTLPRVFGHAHFAATETTTTFLMLLGVYCFLRGLASWRWALVWGVVLGLALNTKINAVLLPVILMPWALVYRRRESAWALGCMVFLAPLVWLATWPWLWHDTWPRLVEYFAFFAEHAHLGVFYLGEKYGGPGLPPAPWHFPLVMLAVTTPLLTLLLFLAGALDAMRKLRSNSLGALFLFYILVTMAVACRPSAAKYDGVRLFLPLFPFLALLAGGSVATLASWFSRVKPGFSLSLFRRSIEGRTLIGAALIVLVLLCGMASIGSVAPRYLSYYNLLTGGPGKAAQWFEITYWGEAVNDEVIDYLNRELPQGAKLKTLALHDEVFVQLQGAFGRLRPDIRLLEEPPYDAHILLHRRGFFRNTEEMISRTWTPIKTFSFRGAPMVSIYLDAASATGDRR
jgi:hypothetical protein